MQPPSPPSTLLTITTSNKQTQGRRNKHKSIRFPRNQQNPVRLSTELHLGHPRFPPTQTMSIEMASGRFSYQRLKKASEVEDGGLEAELQREERLSRAARSWWRFRRLSGRRRSRVRIPNLRKYLRRRSTLVSAVRVSWVKLWRRLMESRSHFAELFAGNYMFMQVSPTPLGLVDKYRDLLYKYPLHQLA